MCIMLYLGTRDDPPRISFNQRAPSFNVQDVHEEHVRRHFPDDCEVVYVGGSGGCGCSFGAGTRTYEEHAASLPIRNEHAEDETRRDRAALAAYIRSLTPPITLYVCWAGEEREPPDEMRRSTIHAYTKDWHLLRERWLVTLTR